MNGFKFDEEMKKLRDGVAILRKSGPILIEGPDGTIVTVTADDTEKLLNEMEEMVHLSQAAGLTKITE